MNMKRRPTNAMIKSIKAILAQDKEKFKVPRKVQDLIPIKNIWPDGIFKVGNKFSKSFRFSDINYLVASREDTISINFGIDKNEMKRRVIALAELDLTIDEWLCFKMKELILAEKLSKENRGEE